MAGRLSFSIAINLLTENFKRGTNQVKTAFRSMQMQILSFAAALGAGGIGLSNLVSKFIEIAKESSRVNTALKNVSGTMGQFADNQRFLLDMAKKYGLEINALTGNFAKFTAAASISGMSIQEQRKIFESTSRAVTAFGMSAEDSNGVFLALSQMMSKGKISSEELRLQMGERLPIALQAMAKAAGTSVAGLDELMKKGKLMSADILPKFANALDEMIPSVDTDNLETSLNRLKNTITKLVDEEDIKGKYKSLIDWVTGAVKTATENIKNTITYAVAAISVIVLGRFINKVIAAIVEAEKVAKASARRAAKAAGTAFDEVAWKAQKTSASIKVAFSRAMLSIRSVLISMAPTAILTVIGTIIAKIYNAYNESKRIKGLFDDYLNRMNNVSTSNAEIVKVKALLSEYNRANSSLSYKKQILGQINNILGTELKVNQNVNKEIAKRISLLESQARAELAAKEVAESENESRKLGSKSYNGKLVSEMAPDWAMARGDLVKEERFKKKYGVRMQDAWGVENDLRNDLDSYIELSKIIKDAKSRLENEVTKSAVTTPATTIENNSVEKNTLQKQQESYNKQIKELGAELEIGKITQAEYNKALGELNIKMYAKAKSEGDKGVFGSEYFNNLKTAAEKAIKDQDKNEALIEFEKVQKEYNNKIKEIKAQYEKGLISQKELNNNIISLSVEAAKSAAGINEIDRAADEFIKKMTSEAMGRAERIEIKPRDTTFDYKKTAVDIASENLDRAKEYADKLKEQARSIGKTLEDEIANSLANVPSLEEALKLAQVKEDIKNLSKELNESLYSGIKDIASSSDRVVNAFKNLSDVMNDVDSTGWEKIMAIWNAMTSTIDSFMSIIKMIENLTEITEKLAKAKEMESVIDTKTTSKKVSNAITGATATTMASTIEKEAATTEVAANTAKGVSAAGASAAKLPFPANIIAIGAAISAAAALFAAIPKFAGGGIITGGPSSGDKILARVNAGEMILNQGQQSRLWQAIQSGRLMAGAKQSNSISSVRIKGRDMILLINNELKSQGKKPIL